MPPVVIAGGIAAAGAIGGAALGASASKKASKQAVASQTAATDAQLQLGRESMGLNREIYNSNYDTLSPWVSRGNVAGNAYSEMLGLPAAPAMRSPLGGTPAQAAQPPVPAQPAASPAMAALGGGQPQQNAMASPQGAATGPVMNALAGPAPAASAPPSAAPAPAPAPGAAPAPAGQQSPMNAFNNFANSAGMQFQLDQGADMINNRYAGIGALQSGAAMKAIQNYGQQTALNNYFMPYMGMLGGLSAQGAQAGSAIAGVGSNFGNTAAGINGQMGGAIQNGADARSNAALLGGAQAANLWGGVGATLGGLGSSYMMSQQPKY